MSSRALAGTLTGPNQDGPRPHRESLCWEKVSAQLSLFLLSAWEGLHLAGSFRIPSPHAVLYD